VLVPATVFRLVAENLKADQPKTRARFMIIASTDVRPSEVRRAEPGELGERDTDLADVSALLGHEDLRTTRKHDSGVTHEGCERHLAGRFSGWQPPEPDANGSTVSNLDEIEPAAGVH
jgi:hypothetical protein